MEKNTLKAMYEAYELNANKIENWKEMSKTELANGYCDSEDNNDMEKRDSYFSAIMCKYWHMVPYLYRQNPGFRLDIEDFVEWVEEAILKGLSYRRWRDENFEVSKEKDGAEKVFNRCIWSVTKAKYKWSNQEVRKINYETYSLDFMQNAKKTSEYDLDEGISFEVRDDTDTNKEVERQESRDIISTIIDYFVKKNDYMSMLIIDSIAYGDSYRRMSKNINIASEDSNERITVKDSFSQFEPKRVVSMLNKLELDNVNYYNKYYKANQELLKLVISDIKTINNKNLYQKIDKTLSTIRNNKELLEMLVKC